ncbi:MAG: hypothetical protein DHS20C15_12950 [Planctomycetota bacterium]|nr:MAG: hypothetical protein DHS20C15_12950 [Planctomycetota bacterium]
MLVALASACSAPAAVPELVAPEAAAAPDLAVRLRQARERVLASLDEQRAELAAVLSAQSSVKRVVGHVASSLEGMQAWIDSESLDVAPEPAQELRAQGAELLSQVNEVVERVGVVLAEFDAFEAQALDQFDGLERAPRAAAAGGADRLEQRLADLVDRALSLGDRVVPVMAASDALVLASARLGEEVEAQRDDVRRLLSIKQPLPMKATLRDPENDVEVTRAPGFETEPVSGESAAAAAAAAAWNKDLVAEIITNEGALVVEFFPDSAPRHVENFLALARRDFYDGLSFHRVIPNFVAQAGCPVGDGSGGPGYEIDREFNDRKHVRGTLSMARLAHPDSAGSQFFLCLKDLPDLDGKYTVFGHLVAGDDTLTAIEDLGTLEGSPIEPVLISDVILRERRPEERPAVESDS